MEIPSPFKGVMGRATLTNDKLIFVIGYPKSGNTWLARLTADALDSTMLGGDNPIDTADKTKNVTGDYLICKMHDSGKSKPDYVNETSKIFYIVRDFRDVLVSSFFHFHRGSNEHWYTIKNPAGLRFHSLHRYYFRHQAARLICKWQAREFTALTHNIKKFITFAECACFGKKRPIHLYVGDWSSHVEYWLKFNNVCVIRYEDLLTDTLSTLKNAFSKINLSCPDISLFRAIERQSFRIRKEEFEKKGDLMNAGFMRKGVVGDWKRFLDEKLIESIRKRHGATMNVLGYDI